MKPADLAGIAIHSESLDEIRAALDASLGAAEVWRGEIADDDEIAFLISECAHAIGHVARRFAVLDVSALRRVVALGTTHESNITVLGGIQDMWDDIGHFLPEAVRPPATIDD